MKKISVVIPVRDHYDLTHQLLFDLQTFCKDDISEIIVVNDGSVGVDTYTGLEWWKKEKILPVKILDMEENVGFIRASNAGLRKAGGDIVVLLSNDVRVLENILTKIVAILDDNPKTLIGGKYLGWNTGWNTFESRMFPYVEGWLLAATSDAWHELGGFDERYAPCDMEDIDLSTQALLLGYTLASLEGYKIAHLSGQSIGFGPEREEVTKRNKERFRRKWMDGS